jgi:hypothetical protein
MGNGCILILNVGPKHIFFSCHSSQPYAESYKILVAFAWLPTDPASMQFGVRLGVESPVRFNSVNSDASTTLFVSAVQSWNSCVIG